MSFLESLINSAAIKSIAGKKKKINPENLYKLSEKKKRLLLILQVNIVKGNEVEFFYVIL